MTAALSILSLEPARSEAQVVAVGRGNARWLARHLRSLEGDVTLDCTRLRVDDPIGASTLVDYARFLHARGRRLILRGLSRAARRELGNLSAAPARQ